MSKEEMQKSKEQLEEEKRAILAQRIQPLTIEGMDTSKLAEKAKELYEHMRRLVGDKYDLEQRFKRQQYDVSCCLDLAIYSWPFSPVLLLLHLIYMPFDWTFKENEGEKDHLKERKNPDIHVLDVQLQNQIQQVQLLKMESDYYQSGKRKRKDTSTKICSELYQSASQRTQKEEENMWMWFSKAEEWQFFFVHGDSWRCHLITELELELVISV